MNKSEVADVVAEGMLAAAVEYQEWTSWLGIQDAGVENLVSTHVARRMYSKLNTATKSRTIYLESEYDDVKKEGLIKPRRGPRRRTHQGAPRMDIVLYNSRGRPLVAVEVKRSLSFSVLAYDVRRMIDLLREIGGAQGSLKVAVVGGSMDIFDFTKVDAAQKAERIERKIKEMYSDVNSVYKVKQNLFSTPIPYDTNGETFLWKGFAAVAFALDLKA